MIQQPEADFIFCSCSVLQICYLQRFAGQARQPAIKNPPAGRRIAQTGI
jgi:hypothetical protein